MINSVRNTVLAILNKNNYGYISPSDFNLFAKQAQLDIFDDYFYQYNQLINQENARLVGTGYADIRKGYEEVDSPFENNEEEIDKIQNYSENSNLSNFNLPTYSIDNYEKDKRSEVDIDRFKKIAQSLEKHCETITDLIKIHNEKIVEQMHVEQQLFEKINPFKQNNIDDKVETYQESILWAREKFNMLKNKAN